MGYRGDSAARDGTAHGAGAGGDDTGGAVAVGVAGDLATDWAEAAGRAAAGTAAAGATAAGATARGTTAARNAAGGAAAAGATAAWAAAGGPAAGGLAATGAAAGLLAAALATALVRTDGATRIDHGVRGWRFWVSFQESEVLEFESLLDSHLPLYPAKELSLCHYFLVIIYPTRKLNYLIT